MGKDRGVELISQSRLFGDTSDGILCPANFAIGNRNQTNPAEDEDRNCLLETNLSRCLQDLWVRMRYELFQMAGRKGGDLSLRIPHNASAKATASRTRASRSEDRVVIKEPMLPFDTV